MGEVAVDVTNGMSRSLGTIRDIVGPVLTDVYVSQEQSRITRYPEYWNAYTGATFKYPSDGSIPKRGMNFCGPIVRKRAAWAIGRKLSIVPTKGNEAVAEVLQMVWAQNNLRRLLRRTMKTLLVTGDAFWYIRPVAVDVSGRNIPKDKQTLAVTLVDPSFCFPVWSEANPDVLAGMVMQFPARVKDSNGTGMRQVDFAVYFTEDRIRTYINGTKDKDDPNPLGCIPFVHLRNNTTVNNQYGVSELDSLIDLNHDYNDLWHSLRRVIRYHGEPTTVVYGARLADMEKNAGKLWSGLPKDAKVEFLALSNSDVAAIQQVTAALKTEILLQARTPLIAYDSANYSVANASGVAMSLLFQPLIEASTEDQEELSAGLRCATQIIDRIFSKYFGVELSSLADEPQRVLDFVYDFESMIPTDKTMELDMALKKLAAGIWSKAEIIRRYGDIHDTRRLAIELASDRLEEVATITNKSRAVNNQPINYAALVQGSVFVGEELIGDLSVLNNLESDSSTGEGSTSLPN